MLQLYLIWMIIKHWECTGERNLQHLFYKQYEYKCGGEVPHHHHYTEESEELQKAAIIPPGKWSHDDKDDAERPSDMFLDKSFFLLLCFL